MDILNSIYEELSLGSLPFSVFYVLSQLRQKQRQHEANIFRCMISEESDLPCLLTPPLMPWKFSIDNNGLERKGWIHPWRDEKVLGDSTSPGEPCQLWDSPEAVTVEDLLLPPQGQPVSQWACSWDTFSGRSLSNLPCMSPFSCGLPTKREGSP